MKQYFAKLIVFVLLISFLAPLTARAIVIIENPLEADNFWDLMVNIVNFLFRISLPIAALMIVVAAFHFLTSAGDPEKVKTAKNIIIWALIGVLVLFLSVAIVTAIKNMLGVGT